MNWATPNDKHTIQVGFVVRPATGKKLGSLFVNPGGPGGDAFTYAAGEPTSPLGHVPVVPAVIAKHFDIIGVQPRGLVDSTPLDCIDLNEKELEKRASSQHAVPQLPGTSAPKVGAPGGGNPADLLTAITRTGELRRELCNAKHPGLAASITTANTIKDWDAVRAALGLRKISILGVSYGTWLGAAYATEYPQHVDRLVLDSAVNPALVWNRVFAAQEQPYIRQFHAFLSWVAANDRVYHLGTTPFAVYQRWAEKVHQEAWVYPATQPPALEPADAARLAPGINPALLNLVAPNAAEARSTFSVLQHGFLSHPSVLFTLTRSFVPQLEDWPTLARYIDGKYTPADAIDALGATPKQRFNSVRRVLVGQFMQESIICNENLSPSNPADFASSLYYTILAPDVFRVARAASSGHNCDGIPRSDPHPPIHLDGSALKVQPLLLQATDDPQTPYQLAMPVRDAMKAHLVTIHDGNHGHVGTGNTAVDRLVADYLVTGHTTATEAPGYVPVAK